MLARSLALLLGLVPTLVLANTFSAIVSPPRIEAKVKSGEVYRDVIEITNASNTTNTYHIKTNDWSFAEDYSMVFYDHLTENSCRPWVVLESNTVVVPPGATKKFRFQVDVPENAGVSECKFVVLIEGDEPFVSKGDLVMPVAGRVGVVSYFAINGAKPNLSLQHVGTEEFQNAKVPAVLLKNIGTSHGRLGGYLNVVDANNQKVVVVPTSMPILVGEQRQIKLMPQPKNETDPTPQLVYPIVLKGKLLWDGGSLDIDQTIN